MSSTSTSAEGPPTLRERSRFFLRVAPSRGAVAAKVAVKPGPSVQLLQTQEYWPDGAFGCAVVRRVGYELALGSGPPGESALVGRTVDESCARLVRARLPRCH
jgi:hypothetical protein